jgi:hypothetical protein
MKTYMQEFQVWETPDGMIFLDEDEARDHESLYYQEQGLTEIVGEDIRAFVVCYSDILEQKLKEIGQ